MALEQQQQLENAYVMPTYARKPVQFVRGQGMRLYSDTGKEYLDFLAGIGTACLGHAHPRLTQAIQHQAAQLLHVGNYYYIEGRGELAQKISNLLASGGETPWKTFFANSGAEASEGAIKLARKYGLVHLQGADTIICARGGFHGRTLGALAATGQPSKQEYFQPLPPGFTHVDLNDLAELKAHLGKGIGDKAVCAVMLECIQGENGVYPCTDEYLQAVRKLTHEKGILLIIDEVQTGIYRTGTHPFAFQHAGITPDVVTMAKGLAGGVPIGAFAAQGAAAQVLEPGDHGSTFGGSPLAIAAANATLDELAAMDAAAHVATVGAYLQAQLATLPQVTEVRGRGLMVAMELSEPVAEQVVAAGLEAGLVLNSIRQHIVRFLPPLICTTQDIDVLIVRLKQILEQL